MFIRKTRFAQGGFVGEIPKKRILTISGLSMIYILSPSRKFMWEYLDTAFFVRILWYNIKKIYYEKF